MKRTGKKQSTIFRYVRFITDYFYHIIRQSVFGRVFSSYDTLNNGFSHTAVGRFGTGSGKMRRTVRQSVADAMENNAVVRALCRLRDLALACGLRTIGLFLVIVGAYSSIMFWLSNFVWQVGAVSGISFVAGIAASALGVFLLFSDISLGYAMLHGFIVRKLLMALFDLSDDVLREVPKTGRQYYVIAVPLAMVLGALFALFRPLSVLAAVLWLVILFLEIAVPEAGVFLALLFIPFAGFLPSGDVLVTVAVLLPLVGYFVKILRGNRSFRLEIQDLPVLLIAVLVLLSGASFSRGAFLPALRMLLLIGMYFVVVNVIATPGWLARCRNAILFSGTVSAMIGIVQFILALAAGRSPAGAVHAGFADCNTFAYFLILAYPFALYLLFRARKQYRLPALFAVLLIAAGTVLSTVESAIAAVLLMTLVGLLVFEKRFLFAGLYGGLVLTVVYAILPPVVHTRLNALFMEEAGCTPVAHVFSGKAGIGSGFSRFLFGLGTNGVENFSHLYLPGYALITAQNTGFFAYTLCTYGFFFVLAFGFFLLLLWQNAFSVLLGGKQEEKRFSPMLGICLVPGVLVFSFFHYAWYDPAAAVLFFAVCALFAAHMRYERSRVGGQAQEEKNDSFSAEYEYYIN